MIAIVDYGVGNLFSLVSSLRALELEAQVTREAAALRAADRIILPGVGAFGDAMENLWRFGLVEPIRQVVENALLSGAAGVVLGHNHPSGVALPSAEDRAATLQVRDALATMDIRLLDHIIIARVTFQTTVYNAKLLHQSSSPPSKSSIFKSAINFFCLS